MQNIFSLPMGLSATPLDALVKLMKEARIREWNHNFLIALKTAAGTAAETLYPTFAESIAFAEQVLLCRDYYAGKIPKGNLHGKYPLSLAIDSGRVSIQHRLRNDFDLAQKSRFDKERVIWITATIRVLQRTLEQIGDVLPTCSSKIHSTIRSFDVFLCAILTAQTPCFTFAALDDAAANAVKAKLCEDVTELVSLVQQLERKLHKELEQMQENTIQRNFMAARLPPPELPPPPPKPSARPRQKELTDVDFAHMEAVYRIREIYRQYGGRDSYANISKRVFKDYKDRLTVAGIVKVSYQTLANHAKKTAIWPPPRWRAAYCQKSATITNRDL